MRDRMMIVTASMRKHYVADESRPAVKGLRHAACNWNIAGYPVDDLPKNWRDNRTTWRVILAPICKRCQKLSGGAS